MGWFLHRLFASDFMPHGACWGWEPWVVWTHVIPDSVIALSCLALDQSLTAGRGGPWGGGRPI
jgi:hypothetical protein